MVRKLEEGVEVVWDIIAPKFQPGWTVDEREAARETASWVSIEETLTGSFRDDAMMIGADGH